MGQKVKDFYTSTSKTLFDIHDEASRIAASHKAAAGTETAAPTTTA
jgi:hypothetical protein